MSAPPLPVPGVVDLFRGIQRSALFCAAFEFACSALHNAAVPQHASYGQKHTLAIKQKADLLSIFAVQFRFPRDRYFVPAIDLRPPGQPLRNIVCSIAVARLDEIELIPKRRSWTDKRHIALQNIEQLRQSIQACPSQKAPRSCDITVGLRKKMRRYIARRVRPHGAKLQNLKIPFSSPDALLPEKHAALCIEPDPKHQGKKQGRKQEQHGRCEHVQKLLAQ